jgi:hypothetical protein
VKGTFFLVSVVAFALTACAPDVVVPNNVSKRQILPDCIAGCMDPDPAPGSPGVYIAGTEYTWSGCTGEAITDSDADGLSDDCEQILAHTFAPHLDFQTYDDVRREPRWAARPSTNSSVIILYMLSYWEDGGDTGASSFWCGAALPFLHPEGCEGHAGDSEFIAEDVRYDATTHHWVLYSVAGSKHTGSSVWGLTGASLIDLYGSVLQYVGAARSAPTIWVADGKHANYGSQAECSDLGATFLAIQFNSDACDTDRYVVQLDIGLQNVNNVGSIGHHLVDCVKTAYTSHPDYASHATECYWTPKKFHGWWNSTSNVGQLNYSDVLSAFGFGA